MIRALPVDPHRVEETMALAHRDLDVARALVASRSDWAFTVRV
jgi:hypothetical protein